MAEVHVATVLMRQLERPLRMLAETIDGCSDELWVKADGHAPVWQHVLHTIYYVQKWIRPPDAPFDPPAFATAEAVDLEAPAEPAVDRAAMAAYLETVAGSVRDLLRSGDVLFAPADYLGEPRTLLDIVIGQVGHVRYHLGCISTIVQGYGGEALPYR